MGHRPNQAHHQFLQIKFYWNAVRPIHCVLSMAIFTLKWWNCVAATKTIWTTIILQSGPLDKNFMGPCSKARTSSKQSYLSQLCISLKVEPETGPWMWAVYAKGDPGGSGKGAGETAQGCNKVSMQVCNWSSCCSLCNIWLIPPGCPE